METTLELSFLINSRSEISDTMESNFDFIFLNHFKKIISDEKNILEYNYGIVKEFDLMILFKQVISILNSFKKNLKMGLNYNDFKYRICVKANVLEELTPAVVFEREVVDFFCDLNIDFEYSY